MNHKQKPEHSTLNLKELSGSVAAAALGVQSSENRERDFSRGKLHQFVLAGVLATALFVGSVLTAVNILL